ncbi:MAG: FadR family transcriptional regulator [Synergistaceae bacterium]|jgi:GntR family transcriptional repressor for pyruvate dehydrogenase complex|nr:FadR family transcriptional regulator [Synergistaceae bacterium]
MPDEIMEKNSQIISLSMPLPDIFSELNINNRTRLSEDLFIKLRDAILSEALPSGYAFPNENELCKRLDIGRSTLREAYASLETMNLITRTRNGTFVNGASDMRNSMNFNVIAQFSDHADIMEYRQVLEVGIASCAAPKTTPNDVEVLREIVCQMEKHSVSNAALTFYDFEFHSTIAQITGNELLQIGLRSIQLSYEKFVFAAFQKNLFAQSVKDHNIIMEALSQNDSEKAAQSMREHLNHVDVAVRSTLTDD